MKLPLLKTLIIFQICLKISAIFTNIAHWVIQTFGTTLFTLFAITHYHFNQKAKKLINEKNEQKHIVAKLEEILPLCEKLK